MTGSAADEDVSHHRLPYWDYFKANYFTLGPLLAFSLIYFGCRAGLLRPKGVRMSTGQPADVPWTTAYHPKGVRMALGWQIYCLKAIRMALGWQIYCPKGIRMALGWQIHCPKAIRLALGCPKSIRMALGCPEAIRMPMGW